MFFNLKLATLTWVFTTTSVLIIAIIYIGAFFVEKHISVINETWSLYQTDHSEKPRLESALRASIGYGGMIHNYKNYVLRHDEQYFEKVEEQLGAALMLIEQYASLELSSAESAAIEDIKSIFIHYKTTLLQTQNLIKQGYSTRKINDLIGIDDQPAIRGLKILRHEVISQQERKTNTNKSRILADIRAALGYDGMIHKFKDYILNHHHSHHEGSDDLLRQDIQLKITAARKLIEQYQKHNINQAEQLALDDISDMLMQYEGKLLEIEPLMEQNKSLKESDAQLKVDDTSALRGFRILEHEVNHDINLKANEVTSALNKVQGTILIAEWSSIAAILVLLLFSSILIRFYVIQPIQRLTKSMNLLAHNKLDTPVLEHQAQNEIGQMARAVVVFKESMIKLHESEQTTNKANQELKQQLEENKQLRIHSDKQTDKALLMAEQMAEARLAAEKAMNRAEKDEVFVSSILNAVRDGIVTINVKGIIESFNPGAEQIFGYHSHEVIGKNVSVLMPEPFKSEHDDYLAEFSEGKSTRDQSKPLEQVALRKSGETFSVEISLNTVQIAGETKITGVVRDITERKEYEEQIEKLAMTDSLTGLVNRHQYNQYLHETLQRANRFKIPFTLMMVDLDKFKPINDTYGHAVGDILLQEVAKAMLKSCREVDIVARLGGDEFSIIVNGVNTAEEVAILAERVISHISEPRVIEGHNIQVGASIGISLFPGDSTDLKTMESMADKALYFAKDSGRNTYRFYDHIPHE